MGDFREELAENTKEIHEIGNSTLTGKELADKIKNDLKGFSKEEILNKAKKTAENMPEQVKVQNLTKERAQVQSIDKDDIE